MLRASDKSIMLRAILLSGFLVLGVARAGSGATVLLSHTGATDPTTEGWSRSTSTTTVTAGAYTVDETAAWRIYDPGLTSGGTNLYYLSTMTALKTAGILASGWELSGTISVPALEPTVDTPVAWGTGSNTWLGYLVADDGLGARRAWALMFGRNASGQTIVSTYQNLPAVTRTLDPGFHEYSIVYDPVTRLSTISVDGVLWVSDYAGYYGGAAAGANQVYWGDNNGQSTAQPARAAYYAEVQFTQLDAPAAVPEPQRALLLVAGLVALGLARRKRQRHARIEE